MTNLILLDPQEFANQCIARQKARDGYIMCAYGQDPKDLSEWYYSGQYSGSQLTQARKWREQCERVYDCQGLEDGFETEQRGTMTNVRARDNYANYCATKGTGVIPSRYRVPGAAVFHHNGSYISHVGFLVAPVNSQNPDGDWYVVEARGVMYGVVKTKLLSRTWNRWGLMDKRFDYTTVLAQYHGAVVEQPTDDIALGSRLLKLGAKGADVSTLQGILVSLGYDLGNYGNKRDGVDGDYGTKTEAAVMAFQRSTYDLEVDGEYGELTHAALMTELAEREAEDEHEDVPTKVVKIVEPGTWYIRKGAGTGNPILTVVKQGAEMPYVSTADNGWMQVEINGTTGWVSNKCAKVA